MFKTIISIAMAIFLLNVAYAKGGRKKSFEEYAKSMNLNYDQVYTVQLLIEKVKVKFDKDYHGSLHSKIPDHIKRKLNPKFSVHDVDPAGKELRKEKAVNLQLIGAVRPIRDIEAVTYFKNIQSLVLSGNEIADISSLQYMSNLRELNVADNMIENISVLKNCKKIESLNLSGNEIKDFSVLASLPELKTLEISEDQVGILKQLDELPSVENLIIAEKPIDSFVGLPNMPHLIHH